MYSQEGEGYRVADYTGTASELAIPDTFNGLPVTLIQDCAFMGTEELTTLENIDIPDSVDTIDRCAFYHCDGLTDIKIPDSVTTIALRVFACCTGLKSIKLPDSITEIDNAVFYYCTSLTGLTIPKKTIIIGSLVFS